jgi:N-hydroxyarylamine O-acetyltransferase
MTIDSMTIDIDAYCARIGYEGPRQPTLETLRALHRLHPLAIPFENLDPLLGRVVKLDAGSLQQKMLHDGRGGYCYEHNLLFAGALRAIGFDVTELAGRVVWNVPPGQAYPRTHLLLLVVLDGAHYIADVGFGGNVLTAPLSLDNTDAQETPHGTFRFVKTPDGFILQAEIRGAWADLYRFDFAPQIMADHEQGNWYVSTHPSSIFLNRLMAARPAGDRRRGLLNNELVEHGTGIETRRTPLHSADELRDALTDVFGIRLPRDPKLQNVLARFAGGGL